MRPVTIRCAQPGCAKTALYDVRTVKEDRELRSKEWKCLRHSHPEQVLSPGGTVKQTLVLTDRGHGRFWIPEGGVTGSGFANGPGFMAFQEDFPTGARLIVTAKVAPPLGPSINSACSNADFDYHDRCPGTTYIGHSPANEPIHVPCECDCHRTTDDCSQSSPTSSSSSVGDGETP